MKIVVFFRISLIWSSHPLMMMIGLVILLLYVFVFIYKNLLRFWVGFLLSIVILRGILVIFSYMLRLIPNIFFENSRIVFPLVFLIIAGYFLPGEFINLDARGFTSKIWMTEFNLLTFYLVFFLLLLIVIVLFLRIMDKGSLRL